MVAQRIRDSVADQVFLLADGQALPVTVSIGVAALADFDRSHAIEEVATALVGQADGALYAAKQQGRNRVVAAT
jgi:diguanylate cyclase (GGDEF)-like protein